MSIGNTKDNGNKGNNFPWQIKMLLGQQCACDALQELIANTDDVEGYLQQILVAIQSGSDYEAMLVVDNTGVTYLEIRIYNPNTGTFDPPIYYEAGQNVPGTPTFPITYINPNTYLAQIVSNTTGLATETTLALIEAITAQMTFTGGDLNVSANMQVGGTDVSGANPVPVTGTFSASLQAAQDYFNYLITVSPYNQIELRLDKANYSDFIVEATSAGASITQTGGTLLVASGLNAVGSATALSTDVVEYRPGNEIYAAGTAAFSAGSANNTRRVGITDDLSFTNSVTFGYEGTSFNLRYTSGGAVVLNLAQASWTDPCDGSPGSKFTLNGVPVALDPQSANIYRVRAGLFGFSGWVAEVFSPDRQWVEVYTYKHINSSTLPVFTNNTFKVVFYDVNTAGQAVTNTIISQCWAAGTNSSFDRLDATLSDRTLAQTTRSVIAGRSSTGGGTYYNVKVNPSGSLEVNANQGTSPWIVETNTTVRTPGLIRATGAGSVAAGARSISVYNAGSAAGSILGGVGNILPGEIMNFSAGGENDTLSVFAYDGTGTTLVITTIV